MFKVFLVSNMYPSKNQPNYGVFVKKIESRLRDTGVFNFPVSSLIRGRGQGVVSKMLKYLKFFSSIFFNTLFSKFDAIFVHYIPHCSPPLFLLLPFIRKPIIIFIHGTDIMGVSLANKALNFLAGVVVRRAALVIVPSTVYVDKAASLFNISPELITVSPSGGIDTSQFKRLEKRHAEVRDRFEENDFVAGFVSRLYPEKNSLQFVEAIKTVSEKGLDIKAVIAGDGPEKAEVMKKIELYGLEKSIDYIGNIKHDKLASLYNSFDLFVFPSSRESLGLVGLEALACGVPVVVMNESGGPLDYLTHNYNGFIYSGKNRGELADVIGRYFKMSSKEREQFSKNAVESVQKFEKRAVAMKLAAKMSEVIEKGKGDYS